MVSLDESLNQIEYGIDVLIDEDRIVQIGKDIKIKKEKVKVIDCLNKYVLPGLINCHTHIPMSLFREIVDGYALQDWLEKAIWPIENKMNDEDIYNFTKLSLLECLHDGVCFINDMYFKDDIIIKAMNKIGVDGITTCTLMDIDGEEKGNERLVNFKKLVIEHPNNKFSLSLHGFYTCSEEYIKKCIELAKELDIKLVHVHFCENKKEVETIKERYQVKNPTDILIKYFKDFKLILAHCVELSAKDITNLKTLDCSVVHNPISNLRLGCGIAKIEEMVKNGINVCLGTDGQGSGSNLSILKSASFASLLQKGAKKDPTIMKSYDVLKMGTINAAKALCIENDYGSVSVGKKANIFIMDFNNIQMFPVNDAISDIIFNSQSGDIEYVIINGKIVMKEGKHVDIKKNKLIKKCSERLIELKK